MLTEIQLEQAIAAFVTFFVLIDAPGVAPIFASLTAPGGSAYARKMAVKSVFVAGLILFFFAFAGAQLLHHLGISLDAFRVAGGVLLFLIALEMVFEKRQARQKSRADADIQIHARLSGRGLAVAQGRQRRGGVTIACAGGGKPDLIDRRNMLCYNISNHGRVHAPEYLPCSARTRDCDFYARRTRRPPRHCVHRAGTFPRGIDHGRRGGAGTSVAGAEQ